MQKKNQQHTARITCTDSFNIMTKLTQGHNEANDWICQGDVNVYLSAPFVRITHTKPYKRLVTSLIDNAFL